MPKAIKKRIEKKIHTGEENIHDAVVDIRERFKQRQQTLVYSAIIFVLATAAVITLAVYFKTTSARALELENEGQKIFYGNTQLPTSERYKNALDLFKKSYAAKKKPHVLLYIADCQYELADYDEAIKTLKELNNQTSDPKFTALSNFKLGMTYAKKGDTDNALAAFKTISSIKDAALQDLALMESGKLLELMGKTEDAKAKYKELENRFPKSPLVNEARGKAQ